jgi:hypothetical protein
MGPLWDFDNSLGWSFSNWWKQTDGFAVKDFNGWWISRMFEDPYFVSAVKVRWNEKKAEFYSLIPYIERRTVELDKALAWNFQRWDFQQHNVLGSSTYQEDIENMKSWLTARISWLDTAINGL